jgi:hypothetical protein
MQPPAKHANPAPQGAFVPQPHRALGLQVSTRSPSVAVQSAHACPGMAQVVTDIGVHAPFLQQPVGQDVASHVEQPVAVQMSPDAQAAPPFAAQPHWPFWQPSTRCPNGEQSVQLTPPVPQWVALGGRHAFDSSQQPVAHVSEPHGRAMHPLVVHCCPGRQAPPVVPLHVHLPATHVSARLPRDLQLFSQEPQCSRSVVTSMQAPPQLTLFPGHDEPESGGGCPGVHAPSAHPVLASSEIGLVPAVSLRGGSPTAPWVGSVAQAAMSLATSRMSTPAAPKPPYVRFMRQLSTAR